MGAFTGLLGEREGVGSREKRERERGERKRGREREREREREWREFGGRNGERVWGKRFGEGFRLVVGVHRNSDCFVKV